MSDQPYDASDPKQVKARDKAIRLRQNASDRRLAEVMNTPVGRAFVWELLGDCGIFENAFRMGDGDTNSVMHSTGKQIVGTTLLARVMVVCPESYLKAQAEAGANQKKEVAPGD